MMVPVKFTKGEISKNESSSVEPKTFKDLGVEERHIQEYVEKNIGDIFSDEEESLIIIGKETPNLAGQRSDLIAIDVESGDLILIEIKRDVKDIKGRGETFVAQAIKYASSLATIKSREAVAGIFANYLDKKNLTNDDNESSLDKARRMIYSELDEDKINKNQRIVLIASSFDDVSISSATWLSEKGVNIKLIKLEPMLVDNNLFIKNEVILGKKEDPYISYRGYKEKSKNRASGITRTYLPRMPELFKWGLIKKDDKVVIKTRNIIEGSEATVMDENSVNYKGRKLSYNEWGQEVTKWSSIQIYKFMVVNDSKETLHEQRIFELNKREIDNDDVV